MNKVLIFLSGAVFGATVFFFADSPRTNLNSSAHPNQKGSTTSNKTILSQDVENKSLEISRADPLKPESILSIPENQKSRMPKLGSTTDFREVHPAVLELMREWGGDDRANYWSYLSDAYNLPRQNYTKEMLRHAIYGMQAKMFDKFLFEVTRDQNISDRYLSNMRSIDKLEDESVKLLRATDLKHDLVIRLIDHLTQTGVASFH